MLVKNKELYEFGVFRLDVTERTLTRSDSSKNSELPDKAFQTLCLLVRQSGHLLTKKELMAQIWPDSFVEENNLDKCIHAIRLVLGEKSSEQKYIQTVRKHGYRFVADVRKVAGPDSNNGFSERVSLPEASLPIREPDNAVPTQAGKLTVRPVRRIYFIAAALVIVIVSAGLYLVPKRYAAAERVRSLAVLPLMPIDTSNRNALHEGGITDSLILKLSAIKGLTVRPLSAVRKYADVEQDPIVAGHEQVADYVLASNYQMSGDRIQVTAQLFDVETGQVAQTFKVEKAGEDTFAMQDAVARDISDSLVARFELASGATISNRGTTNENAYLFYLNARNLMGRTSLPIAQESVEYLEEAVRLDPQFARAYAGLARGRVELSNLVDDPAQDCDKARIAIERGLVLDNNLAEAHLSSGLLKHRCEWNFAEAESEFRRAVEIDTNSDAAHAAYASYLNTVGRSDEAIAEIERAIALSPNSVLNHIQHGIILYFARQYDASVNAFRHASEVGQLGKAHGWMWTACIAKGDEAQAFEWFLKDQNEKQLKPDVARAEKYKLIFKMTGWKGIREEELGAERASPIYSKGRFYRLARWSTQLGNYDEAFAYLNSALERRDAQLLLLKFEPTFDAIRSDLRYAELLKRIGFPVY